MPSRDRQPHASAIANSPTGSSRKEVLTCPALVPRPSPLAVISAALLAASGCVALAAPAAANAASCHRSTSGKSNNLKQGPNGPEPSGGTIFTATCTGNDLDITAVGATDSYEGSALYNSSTDKWSACAHGWVGINGPVSGTDYVMCQDVRAGTRRPSSRRAAISGKSLSLTDTTARSSEPVERGGCDPAPARRKASWPGPGRRGCVHAGAPTQPARREIAPCWGGAGLLLLVVVTRSGVAGAGRRASI